MMEKLRFAVGIAMIWLAAVAGVSATAWFAIDRVGRDVSDAGTSSLRPPPVGTAGATATPDSGPPPTDATQAPSATQPRATRAPAAGRAPAASRAPDPGREPSARLSPAATRAPSASTRAATSAKALLPPGVSQTRPAPSTPPRDRTFNSAGGQVSVRCTGVTMLLRIAEPDNGWRVEVEKSGPTEVEVRFQRVADNSGSADRVMAVCVSGAPVFRVDNKG